MQHHSKEQHLVLQRDRLRPGILPVSQKLLFLKLQSFQLLLHSTELQGGCLQDICLLQQASPVFLPLPLFQHKLVLDALHFCIMLGCFDAQLQLFRLKLFSLCLQCSNCLGVVQFIRMAAVCIAISLSFLNQTECMSTQMLQNIEIVSAEGNRLVQPSKELTCSACSSSSF